MDNWVLFREGITQLRKKKKFSIFRSGSLKKMLQTFIQSVHILLNMLELVNSKKQKKSNSE